MKWRRQAGAEQIRKYGWWYWGKKIFLFFELYFNVVGGKLWKGFKQGNEWVSVKTTEAGGRWAPQGKAVGDSFSIDRNSKTRIAG